MSKYDTDLDYVLGIDISTEELEEIKAEANKIISENKRNKNDEDSREKLALAYLKKAQCRRKLESAFRLGGLYYDDIGIMFGKKGTKSVKKLLKKALELFPDMPEALMQLGVLNETAWFSNDKNYKSLNYISMAIQLNPDYAAAFNNRAMLFYDTTIDLENKDYSAKNKINFRNAVADLTEAIRIRPFDALYHFNRGVFNSRLGEHKEAIEDFSNALNYASDKIKEQLKTGEEILKLRGKEYTELKDYCKAIEDFSETLRLNPDHDEALLMRAKAYYLSGEKDRAKADIEKYLNRKQKAANEANRNEIIEIVGFTPEEIL
ncbi:hypothetical protein R84B8_02194 [Treponema sp. R8-4-B8]